MEQLEEDSPPKSIILIRLRQQPLFQLPFAKNDPVETYNDMIKQLKDQSKSIESKPIAKIVKDIPLIKSLDEIDTNEFKQFAIQEDNCLQQLMKFISKQAELPGWILFSILILCSAILSCKLVGILNIQFYILC